MLDIKNTLQVEKVLPLMSWDIHLMALADMKLQVKRRQDLVQLKEMQRQYGWKLDLDFVNRSIFDALVVTDHSQMVKWVSSGFKQMTGYQPNEIVGKKAKMLQGSSTTEKSLEELRVKLKIQEPFQHDLINHRKNGAPYTCRLEIYPLFNHENCLSHFLALEQEVYTLA